jgi:hypothetical protein
MNKVNKWHVDNILETNIRNYVRNLIHEAMESGFSVQELKNALTNDLQGVKDRSTYMEKVGHFLKDGYYYCVKMLGEPISKGSSRAVFQIDDTRVLKLAFNMKGVAQNKAEVTVYQQAPDKKFMPIVYNDSDMENYFYVISEYVLTAEYEDFKKVVGIPFYSLESFISNNMLEYAMKRYEDAPKVHELLQYLITMSNMGVNIFDWTVISNWGLAKRNGKMIMVTLDNGFTQNVANNFYGNNATFKGSDSIGGMMGYEEGYGKNKEEQLEKKFSKILPKDTIGQDVIEWAKSHNEDHYKVMIEAIRKSNYQNRYLICKLLYRYVNEKYPGFELGDDDYEDLFPQYAIDSVAKYIKKLYSDVNN